MTTYLASGCASADIPEHWGDAATSLACQTWGENAHAAIARGGYGLVIMSNKVWSTAEGYDLAGSFAPYQAGYQAILGVVSAKNHRVLEIRDTPSPAINIPNCLAARPANFLPCNGTPAKWLPADPSMLAALAMQNPKITTVDLTRYFCTATVCPAAIGSVPVYFDGSHLSATYVRTLAPYLDAAVMRALRT